MPKPRIFLSHSAKDPDAEAVLTAVADALEADGYEVLLDRRRLQAGQHWRDELHTWLALCHGAVVLFSKHAVGYEAESLPGSPWVLKEATILTWRRTLDEEFRVVPILLYPIQHADLDRPPFSPLNVNEIQATAGRTPEEIAAEVRQVLAHLKDRETLSTPLKKHERTVFEALSAIREERLQEIAVEAGFTLDEPGLDREPSDSRDDLVLRLTRRAFHAGLPQLFELIKGVSPYLTKKQLTDLRNILLSFWVPPEAASTLAVVSKSDRPLRAAGLEGKRPDVGRMYVQRACCELPGWWVAQASTQGLGEGLVEGLKAQLSASFRRLLSQGEAYQGIEIDDDLLMRTLADEAEKESIFALIHGNVPEADLRALQQAFPRVTFFLVVDRPTDPASVPHLTLLRPPLTEEMETKALTTYLRTGPFI